MFKRLVILIAGAASATVVMLWLGSRPVSEHPFYAQGGLRIIAHRGGAGMGPENTLEAFRRSLAAGANALEMDLRLTRDQVPVILHDASLDRTTNGHGPVGQLTLAQVKSLDAGFSWSLDGQHYPYRNRGIKVPTLAEVLTAFPRTPLEVEIKENRPEICTSLCRMITAHQATKNVLIASFHTRVLARMRRVCPQVATSAGPSEALRFYWFGKLGLTSLLSPDMQALQVPLRYKRRPVITRRLVAAAHRRNLRVEVWTVNDRQTLLQLTDLGVDGVLTDYPDRLTGQVPNPDPRKEELERRPAILRKAD